MREFGRVARAAAVATIALSVPAVASAQPSLLISQDADPGPTYFLGPNAVHLSHFTGLLNTAFANQVFFTSVLNDFNQLMSHHRLILHGRYTSLLSPVEVTNLQSFINSGRRLLVLGENERFWKAWDTQVLGIFGASLGANGCMFGPATTVGSGPLVQGVAATNPDCAYEINGGTPLFDRNYAALFGPSQNALVLLDYAGVLDDRHETQLDNAQFRQNVVDWLAAGSVTPPPGNVVPEPMSLALVGTGLFALAVVRIGRRNRSSLH